MRILHLDNKERVILTDLSHHFLQRLGLVLINTERYQVIIQAKPKRDSSTDKITEDRGFFSASPGSNEEERLKLLAIRQKVEELSWERAKTPEASKILIEIQNTFKLLEYGDSPIDLDLIAKTDRQENFFVELRTETEDLVEQEFQSPVKTFGYVIGAITAWLNDPIRSSFKLEIEVDKRE